MKTSKVLRNMAIILIVILIAVLFGAGMYLKDQYNRTTYFGHTQINGYDASDKTPEEILSLIESDYSSSTVSLNENGKTQLSGQLAQFGYVVDNEALLSGLQDKLAVQKSSILVLIQSLMGESSFNVPVRFIFSQDTFNAAVNATVLSDARVENVNASLQYNEADNYYYIEPEIQGTTFNDDDLRSAVRTQIESFVQGNHPNESLEIDFPAEIYIQPDVLSTDTQLNDQMNACNSVCKAKITYEFGSEHVELDWDTIQTWVISYDGGSAVISDDSLRAYVTGLASTYNTLHYDRIFHTSLGTDITISGAENDYGYLINEESEREQLLADILSNAEVSREPVYYQTNSDYGNPLYYQRDGQDDLAGTYVEVNLTQQHLWFYKNGSLVVECDIVSGSVAKNAQTKTGVFPLAYKESPAVLVGDDAADGYETEVEYWMPFYDGQGLHDANWRSSFGGSIYLTNGSHGCVNMPPAAAKTVFEQIEAGVAIIIYQ